MTSEGDPWRPGVPASRPLAGPDAGPPGHSSTQSSGGRLAGQKVERTRLAPHESSQAHGEHIRTPWFLFTRLFLYPPLSAPPCLLRPRRQVCQVPSADHVTPHTRPFDIPNRAPGGVLPIQVVGFHILRWPLKRHAGPGSD